MALVCISNSGTLTGFQNFIERTPTGYTIYVAQVNGHKAYCRMPHRDKGCYNLTECEDGNSYFCVQNVEMKVDK